MIARLFLCCFLLASLVISASASYEVACVPLASDGNNKYTPAISGDIVVWADDQNGDWDIFFYNLSNSRLGAQPVCLEGSHQENPAVSGDIVVWADNRNGNMDIYMNDLTNPVTEGKPVCIEGHDQNYPAISGNIVVWKDSRNGLGDIYMIDLSSVHPVDQPVCTEAHIQSMPAISGNIIVWMDYRNGKPDVYMYDIADPVPDGEPVCTAEDMQFTPTVSGDTIVWGDYRNGDFDIYLYDLSDPVANGEPVCTGAGHQGGPDISGDIITWYNDFAEPGIYLYDLSDPVAGGEPVCTGDWDMVGPKISGNRIVWEDWREPNANVYMATLTKSASSTAINVVVDRFSVEGGNYSAGETVAASARICNNGDTDATVWASYALRDVNGIYYEPLNEEVTLPAHSCTSFDTQLAWTVPEDASACVYDTLFSVYRPGDPPVSYDTEWIYDIVQVTEDDPGQPPGDSGLLIIGLLGLCAVAAVGIVLYRKRQ